VLILHLIGIVCNSTTKFNLAHDLKCWNCEQLSVGSGPTPVLLLLANVNMLHRTLLFSFEENFLLKY